MLYLDLKKLLEEILHSKLSKYKIIYFILDANFFILIKLQNVTSDREIIWIERFFFIKK